MLDQRGEARLALAAGEILGQRGALEGEHDLGAQRAEHLADSAIAHRRAGEQQDRRISLPGVEVEDHARVTGPGDPVHRGEHRGVAQLHLDVAAGQLTGGGNRDRVELLARARRDERGTCTAQRTLTIDRALLVAHQPGHARHDQAEEDDRRAGDDRHVGVAALDVVGQLDRRRDQRRDRQQHEADRCQRRARRSPMVEDPHRRVQRGGAPQHVEADPAGVEPELTGVGPVQGHQPVGEVRDEQQDDGRGHQVKRGAALAAVQRQAQGRGQQQDVTQRVGDRDELGGGAQLVIVQIGRDQRDPRRDGEADGEDRRVNDTTVGRAGSAAANDEQQADHQRRVDRDVGTVAQRRERRLVAGQLGVAVGVQVAQPEQQEAAGEPVPRGLSLGLVQADGARDRDDGRQPQREHHEGIALQRCRGEVQQGRQDADGEVGHPGAATHQLGHQAALLIGPTGSSPAGRRTPRAASSSSATSSMSTSASVLTAVSCTRKPTSSLGTSG